MLTGHFLSYTAVTLSLLQPGIITSEVFPSTILSNLHETDFNLKPVTKSVMLVF